MVMKTVCLFLLLPLLSSGQAEKQTFPHGELNCEGKQHCQMDQDSSTGRDEQFCRAEPNAPLCSGRGTCEEGNCVCHRRENPKERYTGMFCECSNFDCPYHNNSICGGHGKCECGRCICDNDWTGEDCSCSIDTTSCVASNGQLCNGRGMCDCGSCRCEPSYTGSTCEHCPICSSPCLTHAECVDCRAFGTGPKKDRCQAECDYLILTKVAKKEDIHTPCKMISREDSCFFYFSITQSPAGTHCTVVAVKECP
ncbi:integrin beta-1-like [Syngnathus scovelli]|uniref:integrin beta-1-like n=1 Tax=Syngnathus scovelli TaxID=161590 RepID=UPI00211027FE|nr:integrin beta-1-like [Syngnathus scovelli]